MFDDEWRQSRTFLRVKLSWDRYVLFTALWTGWSVAIGAAAIQDQRSPTPRAPLLTPSCDDATDLAQWLLSLACLHLFSLALLTSLRDRRLSLQVRAVFACRAVQAALLLLSLTACIRTDLGPRALTQRLLPPLLPPLSALPLLLPLPHLRPRPPPLLPHLHHLPPPPPPPHLPPPHLRRPPSQTLPHPTPRHHHLDPRAQRPHRAHPPHRPTHHRPLPH